MPGGVAGLQTTPPVFCSFLPSRPVQAPAAELTGRAQVRDGDSIYVAAREIRLDGIDAPEWRQVCQRDGKKWMAGHDATAWLKSYLANKTVACTRTVRDAYKRVLATCFADGVNVNEAMVRAGWAFAHVHYSTRYVAAETAAKEAGAASGGGHAGSLGRGGGSEGGLIK